MGGSPALIMPLASYPANADKATIAIDESAHLLLVPASALRFRPQLGCRHRAVLNSRALGGVGASTYQRSQPATMSRILSRQARGASAIRGRITKGGRT